jgi:hypothetical protein
MNLKKIFIFSLIFFTAYLFFENYFLVKIICIEKEKIDNIQYNNILLDSAIYSLVVLIGSIIISIKKKKNV